LGIAAAILKKVLKALKGDPKLYNECMAHINEHFNNSILGIVDKVSSKFDKRY